LMRRRCWAGSIQDGRTPPAQSADGRRGRDGSPPATVVAAKAANASNHPDAEDHSPKDHLSEGSLAATGDGVRLSELDR
jgi:hypothetical protein